ncbi:MAG TPA: 3-hydroxyacyl-CoA dehydrogenase family protein [Bryobacteraceae bacterium]|nr:3-hydroxyacyl-CoA dehydrogenase family protein [Bryobacteraceae bacterium]
MPTMATHGFSTAAVLGTGMMGPGIAAVLAIGGLQATLVSRSQEGAAQGLEQALARIETLRANKLLDDELAAEAVKRLGTTANLEEAAGGADIFIESGPENLAWKQDFFVKLEKITGSQAVLASNTSGLSITAIAHLAQNRGRILTTHFWNPPHLVPLVEIVKAEHTEDEVALRVRDLLAACGKTPVMIHKDRPGQLGNRLQMALVREAANIIGEGIASAEDIDLALKRGLGLRYPAYGLLEHQDIVGLDLAGSICEYVGRDLYAGQDAPPYLKSLIADGHIGAKVGQGFLTWPEGKADEVRARRDKFLIEFLRSQLAKA